MKKNVWTVILLAVSLGSVYYAYSQKSRADQCDKIVKQKEGTIASLTQEAEKLRKIAEVNLNEAILQSQRADAIKKCNKVK